MLPWIQSNYISLELFNPEFQIGFNLLIFSASLNKVIFQLLCLSIISALSCTKLMRAFLKSNLSLFLIGDYKKQRDDICMGSSLGPLSTYVIMTDFDEKLRKPLTNN